MTDFATALANFRPVQAAPIAAAELQVRVAGLQARMQRDGVKAVWLDASSSLTYYTGLRLGLSERIHGALVPSAGGLIYVSPQFEVPNLRSMLRLNGAVAAWEEHENPYALSAAELRAMAAPGGSLALEDLKIIVLMVFWSMGEEPDALILDELFVDDADRLIH